VKLREDVLSMRAEMARHKPPRGPLDVKLARGGLVDLEFIVHYLQLREGVGLVPHLGDAVRALVAAGLVPEALVQAHDTMARLLIAARLLAPDGEEPPTAARAVLARACACDDWQCLNTALNAARIGVADAWRAVFDTEMENRP
jgi:glutamate-ammonia-ligase adenylyltransferase